MPLRGIIRRYHCQQLLASKAHLQSAANTRKINLSQVFAGQMVGLKQVNEGIWLVFFMHYDLAYFDDETCRLEPVANPFGPKVLPMSSE